MMTSTVLTAKERLKDVIRADKQAALAKCSDDTMQPFLIFIMDTAAQAIKQQRNNEAIVIQNKKTGAKIQIKQLPMDDRQRERYEIKLFNGNEVRLSGTMINSNTVGKPHWHMAQQYEDAISTDDVETFITATANLHGNVKVAELDSPERLVEWTLMAIDDKATRFDYDENIALVLSRQDDGKIDATIKAQDIPMIQCEAIQDEVGLVTITKAETFHEMPDNILKQLGAVVKSKARDKYVDIAMQKATKAQQEYYESYEGIRSKEQNALNDIFKNYK